MPKSRTYAIAAAAVVMGAAASWLLDPITPGRTVFMPMVLAVLFAAWIGGLWPGLFATVLATLLGTYGLLAPRLSPKAADMQGLWQIGVFVLCGLVASLLSEVLIRGRRQMERRHATMDQRLDRLLAREMQYRVIVEGVMDYALFMLDPQGNVATWGPGAERIKGYRADEIVGQSYARFFSPEDVACGRPQRLLDCAMRDGRCEDDGWRVRKDGSRFWANAILAAIRGENGELRGFVKVTRDMTERRETLLRLSRAEEVAAEAQRAKQFISVLSHELRTPLTPILAIATALERDDRVPQAIKDDLAVIRRNAELEARLVEDLLDWNRISSGKLHLHFETIDAHSAVKDAAKLCRREIEQGGLSLTLELNASNSYIWADAARFQQILWNLLANAIKFTSAGGRITIASADVDTQLVLTVTDTGIGIDAQQLSHVFEAYYQGEAGMARQFGGLGLGLTLARALLKAHHGSLEVSSPGPNQGATFTIRLPSVSQAVAVASESRATGRSNCRRVLLVEDNQDTRRIMARVLRNAGHEVTTAGSVAEGLRAFEAGEFDLLLSDLGLPDGTGWDLMRRIRVKRPIRAIALSGYGTDEDVRNSHEAGFLAHLTKPLDLARLDATIEEICAEGRAPPEP